MEASSWTDFYIDYYLEPLEAGSPVLWAACKNVGTREEQGRVLDM